jgi:hypothetical protein
MNEEELKHQNKGTQCPIVNLLKQFVIWSLKSLDNFFLLAFEFKDILYDYSWCHWHNFVKHSK